MNQGPFLEECIDSVLTQGYPNLEYVIMDGGSTDGSIEIIRRHEKYLKYWQSERDGGHYAAVNAGFAHTTGEVMAWINSDDKYPPWALLKAGWLFARHPEASWITGRPLCWNRSGEAEFVHLDPIHHTRSRYVQGAYEDPFIQQESTFWRRRLWNEAGGKLDADLELAADLELWVRFFRSSRVYVADALLGGFRQHGDQRSVLLKDRYRSEAEAVLARERRFGPRLDSSEALPASALTIDARELQGMVASLGLGRGESFAIEDFLLRAGIARAALNSPSEAAERYKVIVRLNHALEVERRRTAWLYSSALWRHARRLIRFFKPAPPPVA